LIDAATRTTAAEAASYLRCTDGTEPGDQLAVILTARGGALWWRPAPARGPGPLR